MNLCGTFLGLISLLETQIIDIGQKCLYKTLRAGHTSVSLFRYFAPSCLWNSM